MKLTSSKTRMRTDNGKITIGFISFMLVMIEAILYERTVALCLSMDFGEGLSLEVTAVGLGGVRRL